MLRYDRLLNTFHGLNFCRLTHPTNFAMETRNRVCESVDVDIGVF